MSVRQRKSSRIDLQSSNASNDVLLLSHRCVTHVLASIAIAPWVKKFCVHFFLLTLSLARIVIFLNITVFLSFFENYTIHAL